VVATNARGELTAETAPSCDTYFVHGADGTADCPVHPLNDQDPWTKHAAMGSAGTQTYEAARDNEIVFLPVDSKDMCQKAAARTCVTEETCHVKELLTAELEIPESEWNYHPRKCFARKCKTDDSKMCYYWNPTEATVAEQTTPVKDADANVVTSPAQPTSITGYPICYGPMYIHAKKLEGALPPTPTATDNIDKHGCPKDYEAILKGMGKTPEWSVFVPADHTSQTECLEVATCLGKAVAGQDNCDRTTLMLVGKEPANMTHQHDFPEGCFKNSDGCYAYNDLPDAIAGVRPQRPHGTAVCKAKRPGPDWSAILTGQAAKAGEETKEGEEKKEGEESKTEEAEAPAATAAKATCATATCESPKTVKDPTKECAGAVCTETDACCEA